MKKVVLPLNSLLSFKVSKDQGNKKADVYINIGLVTATHGSLCKRMSVVKSIHFENSVVYNL